jgi:hypothetical protein
MADENVNENETEAPAENTAVEAAEAVSETPAAED